MTTMQNAAAVPSPRGAAHAFAPTPKPPTTPRRSTAVRGTCVSAGAEPVDIRDLTVPGGPAGETWLRLFRPAGRAGPLPVVIYVHGAEAPFRDLHTQRLAACLATDVQAAVVVVDYSLAPSARIPVAIEEDYVAATWVADHGAGFGLDVGRIAVGSDPSGIDMADELMLLADRRGGPGLSAHVLFSPPAMAALRAALAA